MRVRPPYRLPEEKRAAFHKAVILEWITIAAVLSIVVVIYFTMGESAAMRTAWREDLMALLPPILFLVATIFRDREPNARFPYGYRRVATVAFFGAALALLLLGLYLLVVSSLVLIRGERPTIGLVNLFGLRFWLGWLMIAALVYSIIPPVILGQLKLKPAEKVHEKTLYTDADINRADWLTGLAGILGIVGIGFGLWWADGAAALIIALDVLRDGIMRVKGSLTELLDGTPQTVDRSAPVEAITMLRDALTALDWVADADVRVRDQGNVLTGEAYIVPRTTDNIVAKVTGARDIANSLDWRMHDIVITLVDALDPQQERLPAQGASGS